MTEAAATLDELRARAEAALADLKQAEDNAENPPLSVELAEEQLKNAEAVLELAERPYWDREHARHALATAKNFVPPQVPEHLQAVADKLKADVEAAIPQLEADHLAAMGAHEASGMGPEHIDGAAQLVHAARKALRRAKIAAGEEVEDEETGDEA